ncbi:MAG: hypothetical protein R2704_17505, partial [Microthrixaceae bacterium]
MLLLPRATGQVVAGQVAHRQHGGLLGAVDLVAIEEHLAHRELRLLGLLRPEGVADQVGVEHRHPVDHRQRVVHIGVGDHLGVVELLGGERVEPVGGLGGLLVALDEVDLAGRLLRVHLKALHEGRQRTGAQHRHGQPQRERHHRQPPPAAPHVVHQQAAAEERHQGEQQRGRQLGVDGGVAGAVEHPALRKGQRRSADEVVLGGLDQRQRGQQHRQVRLHRRGTEPGLAGTRGSERPVEVVDAAGGQRDRDHRGEQPAEHVVEEGQLEEVEPEVDAELRVGEADVGAVEEQHPGVPGLDGRQADGQRQHQRRHHPNHAVPRPDQLVVSQDELIGAEQLLAAGHPIGHRQAGQARQE